MNKISIIYLFFIALLFSACKDEITTGLNRLDGDKLTITAVMLGGSGEGETRVSLHEKNGSLQIESKWQTNDQIHFYFRQDGVIYNGGKVELTKLSNNDKQACFELQIPQGVNTKSKFDLYGFCGVETKIKEAELYVVAHSRMCNLLHEIAAPVWSETKDMSANNGSLSLEFKHLGAYELIHLNNTSSSALMLSSCELTPLKENNYWYFRSELTQGGYEGYYFIPTNSTAVKIREEASAAPEKQFKKIPSGDTQIIANWYFPNNKNFPDTQLKLKTASETILSLNNKNSRNSSFKHG